MGWFSASIKAGVENENQNQSTYGTRTPIVSSQYTDAFNAARNQLDPTGANAAQRRAIDTITGNLDAGRYRTALNTANENIGQVRNSLNRFTTQGPHLLGTAPTAQAGTAVAGVANATLADVTESADVDPIVAQQIAARRGVDLMGDYEDKFLTDVVDTSLADYDAGALEARNALRAGNAGAFGNKRYGVAEGQFNADAARGRGSLVAGLRSNAFNTAAGLGMQDANRFLSADQSNQSSKLTADVNNASNLLSNRQFNAGAKNAASIANANNLTGVSQTNANNQTSVSTTNANNLTNVNTTNANIQNNRDIADQDSRNRNDQLAKDTLIDQARLDQSIADNVVTADGIDTDYAQALFAAGAITQSQLDAITEMAGAWNGSEYDEDRRSNRNRNYVDTEVGFQTGF